MRSIIIWRRTVERSRAIGAVKHNLLTTVYFMLRDDEPYRDLLKRPYAHCPLTTPVCLPTVRPNQAGKLTLRATSLMPGIARELEILHARAALSQTG
jgi:hypothetical protein